MQYVEWNYWDDNFMNNFRVPSGLEDVSKFPNLFDRLYESRKKEPKWRREELEKLAGRNFIRVFQAVEDVSIHPT